MTEEILRLLRACSSKEEVVELARDVNTPDFEGMSRPISEIEETLDFDLASEIDERLKNGKVNVLDLGCGVGRALFELGSRFRGVGERLRLCGVFHNAEIPFEAANMVEYFISKRMQYVLKEGGLPTAKKYGLNSNINPMLRNADATRHLPFEDNSIDLVYSTFAFHYFTDKINALAEIVRVLCVGGVAVLNIDRTDDGFWGEIKFPRLRIMDLDAEEYLRRRLRGICLVGVRLKGDGYVVTLVKDSEKLPDFSGVRFLGDKSVNLECIRDYNNPFTDKPHLSETPEFRQLLKLGIAFRGRPLRKFFGGFLSYYGLSEKE